MYKVNLTAYAEKFEMLPILWIKKTKSLFNSHFSFPSLESEQEAWFQMN